MWFSIKKDNLGWKIKILKSLGIQPIYKDMVHTIFSQVMNHDIWSIWLIWYGESGNNPHLWQKEKWRASMKNQENHMPTYNSKAESKSALWKDNPLASIRKMEGSTWKLNHKNCERIEWKSHFGRFRTSRSIFSSILSSRLKKIPK